MTRKDLRDQILKRETKCGYYTKISKAENYVKLGPFKISAKILNLIYKLDLPAKIKIYSVQHIAMLKPAYENIKPLLYKMETYKSQKENKWEPILATSASSASNL